MPDRKVSLALSFIAEDPEAAAKILEQSKIEEVADFLTSLPLDYQYQVIEQLLPSFAARLCLKLGCEPAAAILTDLRNEKLAKILRLMPKEDTAKILEKLPKKQREATRLLLKYPMRVVGAWMQVETTIISAEMTVAEALVALEHELDTRESLYVTDRDSKLQGKVSLIKLLKARESLVIKDILDAHPPQVSAHMLIENVSALSLWNETNTVAVVDKESRLQGTLHFSDVRKALSQSKDHGYTQSYSPDVVSGIASVYGKTLLVLLNNLMNVVEPDLKS